MKKRILWVSDSPGIPTGNAKITRQFVRHFNNSRYKTVVLGRGYIGWPGEMERFGCRIYPMNIGKPYPEIMRQINMEFKPHVVISCLDM